MTKDNWQTPQDLFDKLNDEFDFHGDVACNRGNKMCAWGLCEEDCDALDHMWYNNSPSVRAPVYWMNPPYSRGNIERFCKKAYEESQNMCVVVALLPGDCSTKWFHNYVMKAHEIRFLKRRVRFIDPDTGKRAGSPTFGSIVVVWKPGKVDAPKVSAYDW